MNLLFYPRSQPEIVKMLIERGAQLNSRDHFGYTALHLAVVKQFTECASVLIQLGCDVNLQVVSLYI